MLFVFLLEWSREERDRVGWGGRLGVELIKIND